MDAEHIAVGHHLESFVWLIGTARCHHKACVRRESDFDLLASLNEMPNRFSLFRPRIAVDVFCLAAVECFDFDIGHLWYALEEQLHVRRCLRPWHNCAQCLLESQVRPEVGIAGKVAQDAEALHLMDHLIAIECQFEQRLRFDALFFEAILDCAIKLEEVAQARVDVRAEGQLF